jgi:drug/metabolite transporter (DMT)-like permease
VSAATQDLASPRSIGVAGGLVAVLSWGGYMAFARAGVTQGLGVADFMLLRFGIAGAVMLPLLAARPGMLAGLTPGRVAALVATGGPPFMVLAIAGYRYAPLTHGAVIQPVTVTIAVTLCAALLLHERLSRRGTAGVGLALLGVLLVAFGAPTTLEGGGPTWVGDLHFLAAGLLWAGFTLLLRHWRVDPVGATAAVSIVSALGVVPWFLLTQSPDRLLALPPAMLLTHGFIQGVASGVIALIGFGMAVRRLGAGGAALFPSLVPVAAVLIGVPVTQELPAPLQAAGLGLATLGLIVALGRRG